MGGVGAQEAVLGLLAGRGAVICRAELVGTWYLPCH